MREIGTIADEDHALTFVDYLLTRKITTHLEEQPDGWVVWVRDEDQVPAAKQELQQFQQHPDDPRYLGSSVTARELRKQEEAKEKQYRKNYVEVRGQWTILSLRRRPLTIILIVACVVIGLATSFGGDFTGLMHWLTFSSYKEAEGVVIPDGRLDALQRGEVWRLVTPIFIHLGPIHIFFNMLCLHFLGSQVESRRGTLWLAVFVLVTAMCSNIGQSIPSGGIFGGFSGVVYGLFGYVWMKERFDPGSGMRVGFNNVIIMIAWLFLCMTPWMNNWIGPVGNTAHVVGLVVGLAVGIAPVLWKKITR